MNQNNSRESRKEYGLLFGASLNYDQHLMESIWDWHHQELQKAREEERERVMKIVKAVYGTKCQSELDQPTDTQHALRGIIG
jgi:hypothetical protein